MEKTTVDKLLNKKAFICDMDGVIYHGDRLLPGAMEFLNWLKEKKKEYLFLTNNSAFSPEDLRKRLLKLGLDVPSRHFYTSALSTARFLSEQTPEGKAYVIGDSGIVDALKNVGYSLTDVNPDYVVISETHNYTFERLNKAVNLVRNGARLIGTNPDLTGPAEQGITPATGALVAPIELATGKKTYFLGKPNPLMMRNAIKRIGVTREETVIVGDRMDTDIVAGVESMIDTVLVLSGTSTKEDIETFAYRPKYVFEGLFDIPLS